MARDRFATLGSKYGWAVVCADGREITELDGPWDNLPADVRLKKVSIVEFPGKKPLAHLADCDRFFFSNEALDGWNGAHVMTAKIFGGVKGGRALFIRVSFEGAHPTIEKIEVAASQLPFGPSAYREG